MTLTKNRDTWQMIATACCVGCLACSMLACDNSDTQTSNAPLAQKPKSPQDNPNNQDPQSPNTKAPLSPAFVYTSVGKRDPFNSYLDDLEQQNKERNNLRKKEETELYELDQYRLTAIVYAVSQPKAMVEDPTSRGYVVHIGSRLGKNGGRITHISPGGLIVSEEMRDSSGKKMQLNINIRLPKSEFDGALEK